MSRTIPPDPLSAVFPDDVLASFRNRSGLVRSVRRRAEVLHARGGSVVSDETSTIVRAHPPELRAQRAAWETYLHAAFAVGLFDPPSAADLLARLRNEDEGQFRGAMAECLVAWALAGKLGRTIEPRPTGRPGHPLEFLISRVSGADIHVEVKSPYHPQPSDGVGYSDRSDLLEKVLRKANRQMGEDAPNVLVIVPDIWPQVRVERGHLVRAFIGRDVIVFDVATDGSTPVLQNPRSEFRPEGAMVKNWGSEGPRFTRISAVLCVEEYYGGGRPPRMEHFLCALHNPNAQWKLSPAVFGNIPQLVESDGEMRWTDGPSARN